MEDGGMAVRQTDRQMDGHTDIQHETITPRHYCPAWYKNKKNIMSLSSLESAHGVVSDNCFKNNLKDFQYRPIAQDVRHIK